MKRILITAVAAMAFCIPALAESSDNTDGNAPKKAKKEVKYNENGEIIKTGLRSPAGSRIRR